MKFAVQFLSVFLMLSVTYFLGNLIPRTDFQTTAGLYVILFGLMFLVFSLSGEKTPWFFIFIAGILLRFSLFLAIPQWSDDYARFLWDGELIRIQENPYSEKPAEFLENHPQETTEMLNQLFPLLNSPEYFSVYSPLNQVVFWLSAKAANGTIVNGIICLRLLLILGEITVFMLFLKLFKTFQKPQKLLWLYWLNPLVILEITGNLHFEGLVLLLLLASVLAIGKKQASAGGGLWGLAVGIKLLPFMLIPAFLSYSKIRNNKLFWIGAFMAILFSFGWLWIDSSLSNFSQSLSLYLGKFEFNASIYYLLREVGFWIKGYNTIATLTKILSATTLILILFFSWKKKPQTLQELVDLMVLIYLTYLILQPVVHPWYLIPAFGLSLLTQRNAFLVWTFAVIFSYAAYGNEGFIEKPFFLLTEYAFVFAAIYTDYFLLKRKPNLSQ